jgi:predicted nucleotidyltransferase
MALTCFNIEMRLSSSQIEMIRHTAHLVFGDCARVTLFGSRVNDQAKGGDVDLMVEVPNIVDEPALMGARVASRVSRSMNGRRVDVILKAPNLKNQPIHEIATRTGVIL